MLPIVQNCWVVPDLRKAVDGWAAMGVGPFMTFEVHSPDALYRGRNVPLRFVVALAQAGDVQIEVIQQLSDGPSAYRDGGMGFHHVCRALGAYDETRAKLTVMGVEIATEASLNGLRYAYADTRALMGCMLEFVDDSETSRTMNATIAAAAVGWDGSDPLRPLAI